MSNPPDNVIYVDFRRDYNDVLEYYRSLNGRSMEVSYSEDGNYFVLGLVDPVGQELFIIETGWLD